MNKRTSIVLAIIAAILLVAWGGTVIGRARKTGKYLQDLAGQEPDKIMDAMNELRLRGKAAGPGLVRLLTSPESLSQPVPTAAPQRAGAVELSDAQFRTNAKARAAWLLGIISYRKATDALIAALTDRDIEVRLAAVTALGKLRAEEAVAGIQGLLADEKEDVKVRAVAALALGMVGGAADVGPLAKVLADHPPAPPPAPVTPPVTAAVPATPAKPAPPPPPPDKTVDLRKAAATALGHSGQPTAVPALVASLKDAAEPNTEVRVAAAYALGDAAAAARDERQSEEAIEGLLGALRDKCGDVRVASAYALRRVTVPEGRKTAVAAGLSKAKDDSHYWVRKAATQSMLALQLGD